MFLRTLAQDLRYGVRVLRSSPTFSAVAVLTLAVGIVANTTVFSWVDSVLLRPYPGSANGRELAILEADTQGAPNGANQISYLDYRDFRDRLRSISGLAVFRDEVFSIGDDASAQPVWGELVSGNYFAVLGLKTAAGRAFTQQENSDVEGGSPVAVISYRLWRNRFGGRPDTIGKTVRVNRHNLTIVGVAPPEFRGTMPGLAFDIWVPVTMGPELGLISNSSFRNRDNRNLYALARRRSSIPMEEASREVDILSRNLAHAYPKTNSKVSAQLIWPWQFHSAAPELLREPLRILMVAAILLLLIVCANVANLLLAHSVARQKEFGIRLSLGASRFRIARQVFTEAILLGAAGTTAALLMAGWVADLLPGLVPDVHASVALGFRLNLRIMAFTALACVLSALLSAVAPIILSLHYDANPTLKEFSRTVSSGRRSHRARNALVIGEVALATVALVGGGLAWRSFQNVSALDPGFDRTNAALLRFYPATAGYTTSDTERFSERLVERLRSLPGVSSAAYADYAPLGASAGPYNELEIEGYTPAWNEPMNINRFLVSPGYFQTMRNPLVEGRDFRTSDNRDAPPVIIVNQAFARRYFRGGNPLGRKVKCFGAWSTVIGLAADAKYFNVAEAPRPHFFAPFQQRYGNGLQLFFFVRTAGDLATLMRSLPREVAAVDPNTAFDTIRLMEWTRVTLLPQKVAASLLGALGVLSLILAAVGLYSVMSYAVTQRTQEIGIRMAMGARPRNVLADVLGRGMALALTGVGIGIAAALGVTRLLATVLIGVPVRDPLTFAGVAVFLISIALTASMVPAWRAMRLDPIAALHCE
jgi:predicted permease